MQFLGFILIGNRFLPCEKEHVISRIVFQAALPSYNPAGLPGYFFTINKTLACGYDYYRYYVEKQTMTKNGVVKTLPCTGLCTLREHGVPKPVVSMCITP